MLLSNSIILLTLSLIVTAYLLKKTILVSTTKKLFDLPLGNRKVHTRETPNLGGVAIFFSLLVSIGLLILPGSIKHLNYLLVAASLIFLIGLKDDLIGTNPYKKFIGQLIAASIIILFTEYRITNMFGIGGIYSISEIVSVPLSILFILLLVNAFNLIDGINCLASGLALFAGIIFCILFRETGQAGFFQLSLALCGSLAAFIYFNKTPAKIFLGDSGSLLLGLILSVFAMAFLNAAEVPGANQNQPVKIPGAAILFGLFIIPVFDTLRVFLLRILNNKSPFTADKNHLHHLLLDLLFSHIEATTILVFTTALAVIAAIHLPTAIRLDVFMIICFVLLMAACRILQAIARRQKSFIQVPFKTYNSQKPRPIVKLFEQLFRA